MQAILLYFCGRRAASEIRGNVNSVEEEEEEEERDEEGKVEENRRSKRFYLFVGFKVVIAKIP